MVYGIQKYYSFGMSLSSKAQWAQNVSEAGSASILREMALLRCTAYSYVVTAHFSYAIQTQHECTLYGNADV